MGIQGFSGIIISLLTGILVGFIVNLLLDSMPFDRKVVKPYCIYCHQQIGWGRWVAVQACQNCGKKRPARFWIVLVLLVGSSIFMHFFPPGMLGYWLGMGLFAYFTLIFIMDLEHHAIVISATLIGVVIGIGVGWYLWGPVSMLIGGVFGFLVMYLFYLLGRLYGRWLKKRRGIEMDEETLGFGDVTLSAVIGLMLGWPQIAGGLLLGVFFGGLVSGLIILISVMRKKYRSNMAVAYAPFLILGAFIFLFIPK